MHNKTIWIVNQFAGAPDSGWGERHYFLTKPLLSSGYRSVIISSSNNHMFDKKRKFFGLFFYEVIDGVEFFWVKTPKYNPKNFSRFFSMFVYAFLLILLPFFTKKIGKPNVILHSSMSIFPFPILYLIKFILGNPKLIFEVRDLWPLTPILLMGYNENNLFIRFLSWIEKFAYKKSDKIITLFEESVNYIAYKSGDLKKIFVLPNGISVDFFNVNEDIPFFNELKNIDKTIVAYTGTLGFANAMDPFFELLSNQNDTLKNHFVFLIIGDGYLKTKYQENCKSAKNVYFLGKIPKEKVHSFLINVDICFIAWHDSKLYNFGVSANKYFDYLLASKPILSAQKGINDPVVKSGAGIIVDNNPYSINEGLIYLNKLSFIERNNLGKQGYNYVLENHEYKNLSKKLLEIIS